MLRTSWKFPYKASVVAESAKRKVERIEDMRIKNGPSSVWANETVCDLQGWEKILSIHPDLTLELDLQDIQYFGLDLRGPE